MTKNPSKRALSAPWKMSSPAKRPASTYQRRPTPTKIPSIRPPTTPSALLNPDAALQQKINSLLFADKSGFVPAVIEEEEFDSAYHESNVIIVNIVIVLIHVHIYNYNYV